MLKSHMTFFRPIKDFPDLEALPPAVAGDASSQLIASLCQALAMSEDAGYLHFSSAFRRFFTQAFDPRTDYQAMSEQLERCEFYLSVFYDYLAKYAVQNNQAEDFCQLMLLGREATDLSVFTFLRAWIFFNQDKNEACIRECELVTSFEEPILTLKAQALIASQRVLEAKTILEIACQKNPRSVLARFQLAKCYYALDNLEFAWDALKVCEHLVPGNAEVAMFFAILALADLDPTHLESSWQHLLLHEQSPSAKVRLFEIACHLDDKEKAWHVANNLGPSPQDLLKGQGLGRVLRKLDERQWHDLSQKVLGELTP